MGLIIDSFAGGGGASTGIELALGRSPDIAINHDAEALAMHARNHPHTVHLVSDVWEVDPVETCAGRPVELLWASPDCRHFSRAKGGKPASPKVRSLAWVVTRWAKAVRPAVIILENVPEFATWGPLRADGTPDKTRMGLTFRRWLGTLKAAGYVVEMRELRACDYGAPTSRKRLFIVARCDGLSIVWPAPTHGPGTGRPWRTAAECIDWDLPIQSIRGRGLVTATHKRIARGRQKFVETIAPFRAPCGSAAFLAKHYGGHETPGSDLRCPLGTVTTQDHNALVLVRGDDVRMRHLSPRELFSAQGFPKTYDITAKTKTAQVRLAGNSVCPPIAAALVAANCAERASRAA